MDARLKISQKPPIGALGPRRPISKFRRFASLVAGPMYPLAKAVAWSMLALIPAWACKSESQQAKDDTRALLSCLNVNGFVADVEISRPQSHAFSFSSSNSPSTVYCFVGMPSMDYLLPSRVAFLLSPVAPTTITLTCYRYFGDTTALYSMDTVIVPKASRIDTVGNLVVYYDYRADPAKAALAISEYASQPISRKYRRLAFLKQIPDEIAGGSALFRAFDSTAYLSSSDLSEALTARMTAFHESAHDFFETAMDSASKSPITEAYAKIFFNGRIVDGNNNIVGRSPPVPFMLGVLFKESSYVREKAFGHPQDNPGEFFASASTIMRFYPEKLARGISVIERTDSGQAQEAKDACLAVRQAYGKYSPLGK